MFRICDLLGDFTHVMEFNTLLLIEQLSNVWRERLECPAHQRKKVHAIRTSDALLRCTFFDHYLSSIPAGYRG